MTTLNASQRASLQATLTNDGVPAFYLELESYGDKYASLGYAVTMNQGWQGQLANAYAAIGSTVDITYDSPNWRTLNKNIAQFYLDAYDDNNGDQPDWQQIQDLHHEAYDDMGVPRDNWFPNKMLDQAGDEAADLWDDWMDNENPKDILEDAWLIAQEISPQEKINFVDALFSLDTSAQYDLAQDLNAVGPYFAWDIVNYSPSAVVTVSTILGIIINLFSRAETERPDPLVLDLNGNSTIDLNTEHTVYFDTDNDGFAEAVNWVAATDGLLARDVNANGNIDNNGELFGNADEDGFSVLSTFDLNSDLVINSSDSIWADLVVWQDVNQDGYSQSGELLTLTSLGITSVNLGSVVANTTNPSVTHDGTITTTTGTMKISNVLFDADFVSTRYVGDYTLDIDTLFLPTLRGYGTIKDLHIAASMDTSLDTNGDSIKDKLVELSSLSLPDLAALTLEVGDFKDKVRTLLYHWAGVETAPVVSGYHVPDPRPWLFLEKFLNRPFIGEGWPHAALGIYQGWTLAEGMEHAVDKYAADLVVQIAARDLFEENLYNLSTDTINAAEFVLNEDTLSNLSDYAAGLVDTAARADFWKGIANVLFMASVSFQDAESYNSFGLTVAEEAKLNAAIEGSDTALTWYEEDHNAGVLTSIEYMHSLPSGVTYSLSGSDVDYTASALDDTVSGNGGNNIIHAGSGKDFVYGMGGNDTLFGGSGNDRLYGETGGTSFGQLYNDDILHGEDGNDFMVGGMGDDILNGGAGDDTLIGDFEGGQEANHQSYAMDDTLDGGFGNDFLRGGYGDDTFIDGYGSTGQNLLDGGYGYNTYRIIGGGAEVWIDATGNGHSYGTLEIPSAYTDETELSITIVGEFLHIAGSIPGSEINVYVDTLSNYEPVVDKIRFASNYEYDLVEHFDVMMGRATDLDNTLYTSNFPLNQPVYALKGNDVVHVNSSYYFIDGNEGNDTVYGASGNDDIRGGDDNDIIYGSGGSDSLAGNSGNDTLYGEEGNDTLLAGSGNDVLIGGTGADYMHGDTGDDIFQLNSLDGADTITEYAGEGSDKILFTDVASSSARMWVGQYGYLTIDTNASYVTVLTNYTNFAGTTWETLVGTQVEQIEFSDSVTINLTSGLVLTGTANGEYGYGSQHNDSINGMGGNDWLYANRGHDVVHGNQGDDLIYGGDGNDTLHGDEDTDTIMGEFGDDILVGGAGTDYLNGGIGNDSLIGGTDNDYLYGDEGDDTFVFVAGHGADSVADSQNQGNDTISLIGVDAEDVRLWTYQGVGGHPGLRIHTFANDTIDIAGYSPVGIQLNIAGYLEQITFDDSTVWSLSGGLTLTGSSGDETGYGTTYADTIYGVGGHDTLNGNLGNDTMYGGDGNDYAYGGDGNDVVNGDAGNDNISGGIGNDILTGGSGNDNQYGDEGDDTFVFAEGHGADAVTEYQNYGNDTLSLIGIDSEDVRLWTYQGYGAYPGLRIHTSANDTIDIAGYSAVGNQLKINNYVEQISFDNSTVWSLTGGLALTGTNADETGYGTEFSDTIIGLGGNDTLYGSSGIDTLHSGDGNDYAYGGEGNDVVNGDAGNDNISGDVGNDTLKGGSGNDTVYGGEGDDTYVFEEGHGADTVLDYAGQGNDTLSFVGIDAEDVRLWTYLGYGGHHGLRIHTSVNDSIDISGYTTVSNQLNISLYIEQISFDNSIAVSLTSGLTLTGSHIDETGYGTAYADIIRGMDGNDTLYGNAGNDLLYGGSGNDTLYGGDGNDVLYGNLGGDDLYGNDGSDTFVFIELSGNPSIRDFSLSQNDKLDFSSLLIGYNPTINSVTDYVQITTVGQHSYFYVDVDGGANNFVLVGAAAYATGLTDEAALLASGHIIALHNVAPTAMSDSFTVANNVTLAGNLFLDNGGGADSDLNGDTLSVTPTSFLTSHGGTVVIEADGDFTYTPSGSYFGLDTFEYTLLDPNALSDTATVSITVVTGNIVPVAKDDSFTVAYGITPTGNVLSNNGNGTDTDGDGGTLSVVETSIISAQGLTVTMASNGVFSYPTSDHYVGADTFTYTLSDGQGGIDTATVTINTGSPAGAIVGTSSNDTQTGTTSADKIFGLGGDDTINGGNGNDLLYGWNGEDTLNGGLGNDTLYGDVGNDTLNGGDNDDTLHGGTGVDMLYGDAASDHLYGGLGADILSGGATQDKYYFDAAGTAEGDVIENNGSSADNDTLYFTNITSGNFTYKIASNNSDMIIISEWGAFTLKNQFSSDGSDRIGSLYWGLGGTANNQVSLTSGVIFTGDATNETLTMPTYGVGTNSKIYGLGGNDVLTGGVNIDYLYGGEGNDIISGASGTDQLYGGSGDDSISGGTGADWLYGEDDNDTISGGDNDDRLYGGTGADTLSGDAGLDYLYGGIGADTLSGGAGQDNYYFDATGTAEGDVIENNGTAAENDTLYFVNLTSTNFIYKIASNNLDMIVISDWGTLTIKNQFASDSSDRIGSLSYGTGGSPSNTVSLSSGVTFTGDATNETLTLPTYGTGGTSKIYGLGGNDTITGGANIDWLYGGDDNDTLSGVGGADQLYGGNGTDMLNGGLANDILYGDAGNDILYASDGTDTLYGGGDSDTFMFNVSNTGIETISDFSLAQSDKIDISDILQGYDPLTHAITDFVQITTSGSNSVLKVDVDGGANNFVQIATISGVTGLTDEAALVTSGNLIVT